jgi:hypothetical protein
MGDGPGVPAQAVSTTAIAVASKAATGRDEAWRVVGRLMGFLVGDRGPDVLGG